jgi:murein L,D-transpeptidase YcbB/YkuD
MGTRAPSALFVVALLAAAVAPVAARGHDGEAAAAIREVIAATRHPEMRWPDFPFYQDEMLGLYEPAGFAPVWLAGGHPGAAAREAVAALLDAAACGLEPEDYDAARLDALLRRLESGEAPPPRALGLADAAISLAFFRQLSDRHIGRVNPKNLHVDLDIEHKKLDLAAEVRAAIAAGQVARLAARAEPLLVQYARVKQALAAYRSLAAAEPEPVPEARKVTPGDAWEGSAALARRLAALGDIDGGGAAGLGADGVYSAPLASAVRRFQYRHGLDTDGVLGARTFAALNTPAAVRVRQLELALERLRWLPEADASLLVVVNVAAFRLWAWSPGASAGRPSLAMDVVVGRALDRQTPLFTKQMEYLVFYPHWNVPYSLVRKDIVPRLRADPGYLAAQGMELVTSFSQSGPGASEVTPEAIDALLAGSLKVRQRPGPANALGPVKFIMPNDADIYLHGTPAKGLFGRARRDFSSGCIRLADPAALAELVLAGAPGWDRARIAAAMEGPREQRVNLPVQVPVFIFYQTAYIEQDGTMHFLDDVYGLDAVLEEAIAAGEPFPP